MFINRLSIVAITLSSCAIIAAFGFATDAQGQTTCGIGQDEIVSLVRNELAPTSNTLVATPQRLGNAAANIVSASPECAVDVVVALCTIRPDSGSIVPIVAGAVPGQLSALQLAAGDSCSSDVAPAAGFRGSYDAPFDDDDEDDEEDGFDDDDDDGVSPS